MPSRKRNWNEGTPVRYKGKVARVARGVYIDPDDAREAAEAQSSSWERGAEVYKKVRAIAKRVMDRVAPVAPALRAPYYGYIQAWYKHVMVLGKPEDAVRVFLDATFPGLDGAVIDAIIEEIRKEVPPEVPAPAERA